VPAHTYGTLHLSPYSPCCTPHTAEISGWDWVRQAAGHAILFHTAAGQADRQPVPFPSYTFYTHLHALLHAHTTAYWVAHTQAASLPPLHSTPAARFTPHVSLPFLTTTTLPYTPTPTPPFTHLFGDDFPSHGCHHISGTITDIGLDTEKETHRLCLSHTPAPFSSCSTRHYLTANLALHHQPAYPTEHADAVGMGHSSLFLFPPRARHYLPRAPAVSPARQRARPTLHLLSPRSPPPVTGRFWHDHDHFFAPHLRTHTNGAPARRARQRHCIYELANRAAEPATYTFLSFIPYSSHSGSSGCRTL